MQEIWELKKGKLPRNAHSMKESSPYPGYPPALLGHGHLILASTAISSDEG